MTVKEVIEEYARKKGIPYLIARQKLARFASKLKVASDPFRKLRGEMYAAESPEELAFLTVTAAIRAIPPYKTASGIDEVEARTLLKRFLAAYSKLFDKEKGASDIAEVDPRLAEKLENIMKEAAVGRSVVNALDKYLIPSLILTLMTQVPGALHAAYIKYMQSKTKSFIKKNYPELAKDKNFNIYFKTLAKFAPNVAADPMTAIPVIKEMQEWGVVNPNTLKVLTAIQKDVAQIRKSHPEMLHKTIQISTSLGQMQRQLEE